MTHHASWSHKLAKAVLLYRCSHQADVLFRHALSTGLSLMMMKPRLERSEQAIAAFELTKASPTLPVSERENVNQAIAHAQHRLREGRDSLDMPDLENCTIS